VQTRLIWAEIWRIHDCAGGRLSRIFSESPARTKDTVFVVATNAGGIVFPREPDDIDALWALGDNIACENQMVSIVSVKGDFLEQILY
jgi:hypothetical protein